MPTDKPKNNEDISTLLTTSISGSEVQVVFEFPTNDIQKSMYINMSSLITVSHSVARAKIPVYLLGETTPNGLALGNKMIAGSIVKLYSRYDYLNLHIASFVDDRYEKLKDKRKKLINQDLGDVEANLGFKEISDFMRDDIAPFNIHLITTSELGGDKIGFTVDTIIGASIINTGSVFSIENLISEETLSFIAKEVRYQKDVSRSFGSIYEPSGIPSGTSLLGGL